MFLGKLMQEIGMCLFIYLFLLYLTRLSYISSSDYLQPKDRMINDK